MWKSPPSSYRTKLGSCFVFSMKYAFEAIRPLGDTKKVELHDEMSDVQQCVFRKVVG